MKTYSVYILTNKLRTTLYIGVTNDLIERILEHYSNRGNPESFTGRYNCHNLIYYEDYVSVKNAIAREKQLKNWRREKKIRLIKNMNPELRFLNDELMKWPP